MGSIDHQLNALALDEVDYVRTSFFHLVDALDVHTRGFNHLGCAVSRYQLESHVYESARNLRDMPLVSIGDADEDRALGRQLLSSRELRLRKGLAEVIGNTHHFAGGFHFGAEHRVDAGEFAPREYWRLHVIAVPGIEICLAVDEVRQEFPQLAAGHQARSDLCHGHAG